MGFSDGVLERRCVESIRRGDLEERKFRFDICQDYGFLLEDSRTVALGTAQAHELESLGKFAELLHATVNVEMELHREYAAWFGISKDERAATAPAPTTYAYTRHLLDVAARSTLAELGGALLPCQWGYAEQGLELAGQGEPAEAPLSAE